MKASVLFAATLLLAATSFADIIYYNGTEATKLPAPADVGYSFYVADDFRLEVGYNTIRNVHWWGGYSGSGPPEVDHFTIALYAEVGGAPASQSFYTFQVQSYVRETWWRTDYFNNEVYLYSAPIAPITLTPDTTYYLSIWESNPTGPDWVWSEACYNCSESFARTSLGAPWEVDWMRYKLAFYLTDDRQPIPEPGTVVILGMGLAGLTLRRIRGGGTV